jgi:hypothetical protein
LNTALQATSKFRMTPPLMSFPSEQRIETESHENESGSLDCVRHFKFNLHRATTSQLGISNFLSIQYGRHT